MSSPTLAPASFAPLRPPSADGLRTGVVAALAVHGLLVAALSLGVSWRTADPIPVAAELWAAVPKVAVDAAAPSVAPPPPPAEPPPPAPEPTPAPPPVPAPPPPAPRADADIATSQRTPRKDETPKPERKDEKKAEKKPDPKKTEKADKKPEKKADPKKPEKAEKKPEAKDKPLTQAERRAEQRRAEAERRKLEAEIRREEERVEALRKATLARMQDELSRTGPGGSTSRATSPTGKGDVTAAPSAAYAGRIVARVRPNIVLTEAVRGNPSAEVEVRAAPDGTILGQKLLKSSGNEDWDRAVLRAVEKTEMLPRDTDGRVPPLLVISFRPSD